MSRTVAHIVVFCGLVLAACAAEPSAHVRAQGRWQVEPSAEDARQAALLALALSEPAPTEAQIAAAALVPAEEGLVRALLAARADNPDAPQLQRMRAAMASIGDATLEISVDEMTFRLGETVQTRPYRVLRMTPTEVHVETVDDAGVTSADILRLEGDDSALLIEADGETTRLRRDKSSG